MTRQHSSTTTDRQPTSLPRIRRRPRYFNFVYAVPNPVLVDFVVIPYSSTDRPEYVYSPSTAFPLMQKPSILTHNKLPRALHSLIWNQETSWVIMFPSRVNSDITSLRPHRRATSGPIHYCRPRSALQHPRSQRRTSFCRRSQASLPQMSGNPERRPTDKVSRSLESASATRTRRHVQPPRFRVVPIGHHSPGRHPL